MEKLSRETPIFTVSEGSEPHFFTRFFNWDCTKSLVSNLSKKNLLQVVYVSCTCLLWINTNSIPWDLHLCIPACYLALEINSSLHFWIFVADAWQFIPEEVCCPKGWSTSITGSKSQTNHLPVARWKSSSTCFLWI